MFIKFGLQFLKIRMSTFKMHPNLLITFDYLIKVGFSFQENGDSRLTYI